MPGKGPQGEAGIAGVERQRLREFIASPGQLKGDRPARPGLTACRGEGTLQWTVRSVGVGGHQDAVRERLRARENHATGGHSPNPLGDCHERWTLLSDSRFNRDSWGARMADLVTAFTNY